MKVLQIFAGTRSRVGRRSVSFVMVLCSALLVSVPPVTADSSTPQCQQISVPVTVAGLSNPHIYGELCLPSGQTPSTVQLLVHGASYTHDYFDWPQQSQQYSYVEKAVQAGYATFNVDRLGAGQSTHPLSALVTLDNGAEALHDVIARLRAGLIGGHAYSRVVWVGHSFGSIYAWSEAAMYQDVDAFVLTGITHAIKPSFVVGALTNTYPATLDPKFLTAGLDPGYLATLPGKRDDLFYNSSNADPAVINLDEQLKDVVTGTEIGLGSLLITLPLPQLAPSRSITVPVFVVLGQHDNLFCDAPDGPQCSQANLLAQESPYYSAQANLEVAVIPDAGHDIQLHYGAAQTSQVIIDWIDQL